jgi:uncharacterized protein
MNEERSIIWRRLDIPGHEFARISTNDSHRRIEGTAILVGESGFCKLDYTIECDRNWQTLRTEVAGFVGEKKIGIEIAADAQNVWTLNGREVPEVRGCIDVDLNFSPVTNTLPIRRLNLAVGERSIVSAAWLRFPSFRLEPLEQVYERTGDRKYRYESGGGSFTSELEVTETGFVVNYGNLWHIERGDSK